MKKFLLPILTFILFFIVSQIFSQETYINVYYKKVSTFVLNKKKQTYVNKILKQTQEEMEKLEYNLTFNNIASIFKELPKMDLNDNSTAAMLSKSFGDTEGIFYTDKKTGKTIREQEFESELFLVEHEKMNDWELTQEKKKIGKYICYKATRKDSYINRSGEKKYFVVVAWYTLELPYNFGPAKYNGLPGLILELTNRQAKLYVSKIELNPKKQINILKPKKGKNIKKMEYDNFVRGLAKNFDKTYKRN